MSPLPLTPRQERLLRVIETSLRTRGFVPTIREMGKALGLTSIRGVTDHLAALEQKGYIRRTPGHRRAVEILRPLSPTGDSIPILGRVAAGRPLLAVENVEGILSLGPELLGKGTHFALRVQGDSMIEADIQDGDYVIVRQQEVADPGDIVIALLGEEATVKRLRKKGKAFFLEAANPAYAPIPLTRSGAPPRLVGKMIGLYRRHNGKP